MNGLFDAELEQAVLGTILQHPDSIWSVGELRGEHFGFPLNGRIFDICYRAAEKGDSVDPITVSRALGDDPDLLAEDGPGRGYIVALVSDIAATKTILSAHAKALIDLARRRRLVVISERLRADAETLNGKTVEEMVSEVETQVSMIGTTAEDAVDHHTVLDRLAYKLAEQRDCVSTNISSLDKSMGGGLYEGHCYGFEGLHKAGKSALVGTLSYNLNEAGVRHLYIAAEMGSVRLAQRYVARGIRRKAIEMLFRPKEFVSPTICYRHDAPNNILWADVPGLTFKELRRRVAGIVRRHNIRGFILDGWQLVRGVEKGQTLEGHLRDVAQWVADYSNQHGLFSIITAQLNQNGLAHSCSQGLEMACDQVYTLNREEGAKRAWMRQRVSRYTPITHVGTPEDPPLLFHGDGPYFEDIDSGLPPPQAGFGFDDDRE